MRRLFDVTPVRGTAAALFWLLLWAGAARLLGSSLLLPGPVSVLLSLLELMRSPDFWLSVLGSLARVLAGFAAGAALGVLLGFATGFSALADSLLRPAMSVIKTAPVASFIILALVWLSGRFVPVLTAALIVLPLVWSNVHTGLRGCDRLLAEAAAAFKMPPGRRLLFLYLPSVLPYLSSAVCTGMGMAWKAGIAAEILCTPKAAIGSELYMSKIYFDTPALFAWTSVVIALSALIEALLRRLIGGRRVQL